VSVAFLEFLAEGGLLVFLLAWSLVSILTGGGVVRHQCLSKRERKRRRWYATFVLHL